MQLKHPEVGQIFGLTCSKFLNVISTIGWFVSDSTLPFSLSQATLMVVVWLPVPPWSCTSSFIAPLPPNTEQSSELLSEWISLGLGCPPGTWGLASLTPSIGHYRLDVVGLASETTTTQDRENHPGVTMSRWWRWHHSDQVRASIRAYRTTFLPPQSHIGLCQKLIFWIKIVMYKNRGGNNVKDGLSEGFDGNYRLVWGC
jgi:hypothetical protein